MGRIVNGVRKYGMKRAVFGTVHKIRNRILQKRFNFGEWHLTPIEFREYALWIQDTINHYIKAGKLEKSGLVVEIGCGLGEIMGGVLLDHKIGIDRSQEVIEAAGYLYPKAEFKVGSFDDLSGEKIELLIIVNFIHEIDPRELKEYIREIISRNDIRMIVIDRVENIEKSNYRYAHSGEKIFDGTGYEQELVSDGFEAEGGAIRFVEFWVNI